MAIKVIQDIENNQSIFKKLRHEFHQHPELAFEEINTSNKVVQLLKSYGFTQIYEDVAKTGVIAVLKNGEGPCFLFRADMDALPIQELSKNEHRSKIKGQMHACGHDGHTSMLLAAAFHLAKFKDFKGSIVFLFQPAEELGAGAKIMLKQEPLKSMKIDGVFGMHNLPNIPPGHIVASVGPVMAAVNFFTIKIKGRGGHAAMPHLTNSPIKAAMQFMQAVESSKAQWFSNLDPVVISFTAINSGSAFNVIPENCEIKGTIRCLSEDINNKVDGLLEKILHATCKGQGVTASLNYEKKCGPTINHQKAVNFSHQVLSKYIEKDYDFIQKPIMASEDYAYFLERFPGMYAFIGNGQSESLHHPNYDFNDENIAIGASFYVYLAKHMHEWKL